MVIRHHRELVSGDSITLSDDEIIDFGVLPGDRPIDRVIHHDHSFIWCPQTNHRPLGIHILPVPAVVVITRSLTLRCLTATDLIEALLRAVAVIGLPLTDELIEEPLIVIQPLALVDRRHIGGDPHPGKPLQNRLGVFLLAAFAVGILDTDHELAAAVTGMEIVEQSGACHPNVQVSCRRGGTTDTDRHYENSQPDEIRCMNHTLLEVTGEAKGEGRTP